MSDEINDLLEAARAYSLMKLECANPEATEAQFHEAVGAYEAAGSPQCIADSRATVRNGVVDGPYTVRVDDEGNAVTFPLEMAGTPVRVLIGGD